MSDTIAVRPMVDEDLPAVLETLRAALGETPLLRRTPELWAWKHILNPFGRSLVLVAHEADRIAGVRAFMRWELATPEGATLRCVRAVDTATHPDFQRRGVFQRLTEAAVGAARDDGVDLIFNTPNPQSGAGYRKMGWLDVGPIGVMIRPSMTMVKRRDSVMLPDPNEVLPAMPTAAGPYPPDRAPRGLRTHRSTEYREWRFGAHPTAHYRRVDIDGSTAVIRVNRRNGRDELVVSDVAGPNPRRAIVATARVSRGAYLAAWFSSGSPERKAAIRAGLVPVPRVRALTLVARPLRRLPLDVASPASWDLAMGDLELL